MAGSDLFKLYRYDPSMAAAIIFVILFLVTTALHMYQVLVTRTWFFIPFLIGGFFQWIGYIGRAMSAQQTPDWTVGPYVMQTLLLLVSPAMFAASIYMILGRLIMLTDGECHSIIPRKWLTKLFVLGDVLSFVLQGAGGGIMASGTLEALTTGEHLVIGGLVVQVLFFSLFAVTAAIFHKRLFHSPTRKVLASDIPWQGTLYTLYAASALIMVRSIYRLIEYAQGNAGYLQSREVYLYLFDSIFMLATMLLFAYKHPSIINAKLRGGGKAVSNFVYISYVR